jgi:hypothetical protein
MNPDLRKKNVTLELVTTGEITQPRSGEYVFPVPAFIQSDQENIGWSIAAYRSGLQEGIIGAPTLSMNSALGKPPIGGDCFLIPGGYALGYSAQFQGVVLLVGQSLSKSEIFLQAILNRIRPEIEKSLLAILESREPFELPLAAPAFDLAKWISENRRMLEPFKDTNVAVDLENRAVVLHDKDGLNFTRRLIELEAKTGKTFENFHTAAYGELLARGGS